MRVIHTVGGIAERSGGPSRTVTSLCSSIARLGGAVDLAAGIDRSDGDRLVLPDAHGVSLHLVDARRMGRLHVYPGFSRTVSRILDKQGGPALIHDHGIWGHTNVSSWLAARRRGVPYVLSPRGMLEPWALEFKARKKKLAWMLYQKRIIGSAAAVVATSEQECENVKRLFPKLPVAIIPNGVNLPDSENMMPRGSHCEAGGTVLFMSRIHPVKNLTGLLHAWASLPAELADGWRLVIAGPDEGGHAQKVISLARELGLQNSVQLIGAVSEDKKAMVFRSADVFVLPSHSENFGVVVAEALTYGVPVITTTGTPWKELPQRRCGWWVDVGAEPLAHALREALALSNDERREMGARGKEYVRRFAWHDIAQQTVDVYRWVLGYGAKPAFVYAD